MIPPNVDSENYLRVMLYSGQLTPKEPIPVITTVTNKIVIPDCSTSSIRMASDHYLVEPNLPSAEILNSITLKMVVGPGKHINLLPSYFMEAPEIS